MVTRFMEECPTDIDYYLLVLSTEATTKIPLPAATRAHVYYLGPSHSPVTYLRAAFMLIARRNTVIVSSTWKAAMVVWLSKRVCATPRHLAFTHRSSCAHWVDRIMRTWQVRNAHMNIADSASSARWVSNTTDRNAAEVVNPIFSPPAALPSKSSELAICFIGRLAQVKNLDTVCKLAEKIAAHGLTFVFHIYGPDGGSKATVDEWIKANPPSRGGYGMRAAYMGPIPPKEVHQVAARYHFILSCSHTEGFAMSIAEAMQVGTVPVVGMVGGPSNYCSPDNAITLADYADETLEVAAQQVHAVWQDAQRYQAMSGAAMRTFGSEELLPSKYAALLRRAASTISTRSHA